MRRDLITIGVWLFVGLFLTTDGQAFTQSLVILTACIVGPAPWLRTLFQRKADPLGRAVATAVVGGGVVVMAFVAPTLPESYDYQRRFNARRPAADDPRVALSEAYRVAARADGGAPRATGDGGRDSR